MRANRLSPLSAVVIGFCFGAASSAQTLNLSATTTLLPQASGAAAEQAGFLVQSGVVSGQLQFDLAGLPADLKQFERCTLRLVVKRNELSGNVIVKGRLPEAAATSSIVNLGVAEDGKPIVGSSSASGELCKALYTRYGNKDGKGKVFAIVPFTDSSKAQTRIDSLKSVGAEFSNLPRLVIEYKAPPPSLLQTASWPQHQRDPEHTGRSLWAPAAPPSGFTGVQIDLLPLMNGKSGSLVDYPLIYQGTLYIIYKIAADNYLVCVDFGGKKLWEKNIGPGTVQRSPVIGLSGFLYVVTEGKIAAYDLGQGGSEAATYSLAANKLTQYTDLTVGNDGSVFLALQENGVNYMLGFTAKLAPFIRRGPFDTRISSITASVGGGNIFAETPKGAVVVDIANPVSVAAQELKGAAEYYHVPVAGAAGAMFFAAFKDMGSVWGYTLGAKGVFTQSWQSSGSITPQPALGSNGCLYFIQDGKLKRRGCGNDFDKGNDLKTSSNLVMDGADNLYFWSNGALLGYNADGEPLFAPQPIKMDEPKGEGPEKFLRLMMAPDGTLWTNNRGSQSLYAFKPGYADPKPTVSGPFRTRTVYRATDTLSVAPNVTVPAGTIESPMQILFEARNGISFSAGFNVEKGASLVCRTGF